MHRIEIAAAVIVEGGRMLVVRKQGTELFMQPGGKREPGETPEATLCRELHEEIGVSLVLADLSYLGTFSAKAANEKDSIVSADLFAATIGAPPEVQAEIAELAWLPLEQAEALPLAPLTAEIVVPLARRHLVAQARGGRARAG